MKSLFLALSFLTRIPTPFVKEPATKEEMASCVAYFPLVGVIVGTLVALIDAAAYKLFNTFIASAVDLVAFFFITGGLHLDGLMDTADGLLSGKGRERMLEIMKDSRVGALGACAAILMLLLKFSLIASITGEGRFVALVSFPAFGRWAMVPAITFFAYARKEGLGKSFGESTGNREFLIATLSIIVLGIALLNFTGLMALIAAGAVSSLMAKKSTKTLGGLTGDVYGAINELAEAAALMVMASHL